MTAPLWTATQELQGALVILDETQIELEIVKAPDAPGEKVKKAREAIERALKVIQHVRCDMAASLDHL